MIEKTERKRVVTLDDNTLRHLPIDTSEKESDQGHHHLAMHKNIAGTITNQDVTITGAMITGTREDIINRNHIHHNLLMKKRDSTAGKADVTKSSKRVSKRSLKRRICRPNDLKTSNRVL